MTEQEKAKELIDKFITAGCLFASAKSCASICVEACLAENISVHSMLLTHGNDRSLLPVSARIKYWQTVLAEIEKL